ncbi:ATP-binding cassette domain-containing protein [Rhizobium sp. LCM 4573]|uniref:ATP-binding cassette domain-containing protein n=1 Tax=Rhizobium sp. LCM 4573 TaxID=1848291 RepID=UPI0008DA0CA7|nr:ATP-binding cassette domain-containing protein [Rhizobium sp. LCM 4573]OHV82878.1 nickel import ATP-binding protein NikD [Rhizobium sp. LCM 4573]
MTGEILSIENLSVEALVGKETRLLVDGLSLTVRRGRISALVGASGSGKSMTCSAALGVLPPGVDLASGRVTIDGVARDAATLRGRHVATIMQAPRSAFNPVRTMSDHAIETLKALGRFGSDAADRIEASMTAVGLNDVKRVLGLHAFEMSGGMLQRMMIALALLSEAPFLFADEPTTDLDLVVQLRVLELLERLVEERNLGVLLVTHDMGVAARLADDVAVLDRGRIVEQAPVMDIFQAPRHHVTCMLVRAHLSLYGMELEA